MAGEAAEREKGRWTAVHERMFQLAENMEIMSHVYYCRGVWTVRATFANKALH